MEKMLNNILFYTNTILAPYMEAFVQSCSVKIGFLKISQNSQEITFARGSFLIKSQAATLLIKRLRHMDFPVVLRNFQEYFLRNTAGGCFWPYT